MDFVITSSPHIRSKNNTQKIMMDVIIALIPTLIAGIWYFGFRALMVTLVCIAAALAAEWIWGYFIYHRNTIGDCSAAVTGLLLALTLPVTVPYWLAAVGSIFAVIIAKGLCGGLGRNLFNPALAARAFLMMVWPVWMVRFAERGTRFPMIFKSGMDNIDAIASATPLHDMQMPALPEIGLLDMFLGNKGGCIGEVCTLAILLGGIYLAVRKVISLRIPLAYLGTVAILSLVFFKTENPVSWMLYSLLSGGVVLGAFFMATDYTTSPVTSKGQMIYGIGCGALTVFFRSFGLFPEGVTYAILLMNAVVWLMDFHTAPRRFGTRISHDS